MKKYEVLGNLTPVLPSLRGPADLRLTIVGPTGRHKKGDGGGGKAKGVWMRRDGRRGSGLGPRHGWAQRRMRGITIYIALLCLRIMYVHMLNQLFREYSSLDIAGNRASRGERKTASRVRLFDIDFSPLFFLRFQLPFPLPPEVLFAYGS